METEQHRVQRIRQAGTTWLSGVWRSASSLPIRFTKPLLEALGGGSSPAQKRHMGGWLGTVGTLLLAIHYSSKALAPGWFEPAGVVLVILAWWIGIVAGDQEESEAHAKDLVAWKREEQAFRRAAGVIWRHLKTGAYARFAGAAKCPLTLEDLVSAAGWPDRRTRRAETLEAFCRHCFPPPGWESPILTSGEMGTFRWAITGGGGSRKLAHELEPAKDILEIWGTALSTGGSSEAALRKVVLRLGSNHENSLRLIWFLLVAYDQKERVTDEPDYQFLKEVRSAMEGLA